MVAGDPFRIFGKIGADDGSVSHLRAERRTEVDISQFPESDHLVIPACRDQILCLLEIEIGFCACAVGLIRTAVCGHVVVAVSKIRGDSRVDLFHVSKTADREPFFPCGPQRRKQKPGKDRNNRNYNKKFNESKILFHVFQYFPPFFFFLFFSCFRFSFSRRRAIL